MGKFIDLTGQRFGRLLVIGYQPGIYTGEEVRRGKWICRCDCGNEKLVLRTNLNDKRGNRATRSCGCQNAEALLRRTAPPGHSGFAKLYASYVASARGRKIDFSLSKPEFRALTSQNCHYCGIEPSQISKSKASASAYKYNGIDRVDNSVGYEWSNCVPCCSTCNYAKRNMSYNDFMAWTKRFSARA